VKDQGLLGAANALVRPIWRSREEVNPLRLPVSAKMQEPLCGWSFSQVARDRGAEVNCSLCVQLSALFTRRDPAPTEGTIPLPAPRISLNTALYLHICP
jgi:hypothetical protein